MSANLKSELLDVTGSTNSQRRHELLSEGTIGHIKTVARRARTDERRLKQLQLCGRIMPTAAFSSVFFSFFFFSFLAHVNDCGNL
jgi:hypothetical protein